MNMTTTILGNGTSDAGGIVSFDNLYPAILQCFVVVISGYIAGRTRHVTSSQGRGIATFVSTFCLPALLFRAMCTLDFSQVNWNFLLAILIAKASVFIIVAVVTLLVKRPLNLGYAGIFAIFCTQSNDFALGYPILQALYRDTHPEYLKYIYLVSPISLLILNPIGFTLMEIHRHWSHGRRQEALLENSVDPARSGRQRQESACSTDSARSDRPSGVESSELQDRTWGQGARDVLKGVLLNPIIFMTAIGIAGNFIFNHQVPFILDNILSVLGDAFSACALFYLGLSMVGKVQSQFGMALVVPVLLIFVKSLLLPMVAWEVVSWLQPNETLSTSLSMYGFLYGTFPTAPSVLLYASQYSVAQHTVATGMVAGTFLSAPLMFVSAKMMTVMISDDMDYRNLLLSTSFDASIVGIVCCVWVLISLVVSSRWRRVPHRFTICLLVSQLFACIGLVAYREAGSNSGWQHYVQFVTLLIGVFASRCWTAALAVALCLLHTRSLCSVLRCQVWLGFLGFGFPVLMTGLLFLIRAQHISDQIDPAFHYGFMQTLFSAIILVVSLLITLTSIVIWQRNARNPPSVSHDSRISSTVEDSVPGRGNSSRNSIQNSDSLPQSSSPQGNYQACSNSVTASSIEDIIPFPSTADDSKTVVSDGSCGEDHGLVGTGLVPIDERTCLLGQCATEERLACRQRLRQYAAEQENSVDSPQDEGCLEPAEALKEEYQSTQHLLLLLLLTVSMFVGLFLCIWKMFNNQVSGIYVEIEFLDTVFNYGQPFLVFIVFGFDTRLVFSPLMRRYVSKHKWLYLIYVRIRRWLYGAELVRLPKSWELDSKTQTICRQFLSFHINTCKSQICRDGRFRLRRYQKVFTGAELCDWLIGAGLAADRAEAVIYGRRLLLGRVVAHVTGVHHFQDSPFFYTFVQTDDASC